MNRYAIYFVLIAAMSLGWISSALGQVGKETSYWNWTVDAEHHRSIVQVTLDGGMGTGVIVYVDTQKPVSSGFEGYCLTAYHVVSADQQRRAIRVQYADGRASNRCKVVEHDKQNDVALLWVWVPDGIKAIPIADTRAMHDHELEFAGLGGGTKLDCCLRHFAATASLPTNESVIYADLALLPGDSGGPVFNTQHELVGIISGGWFWWDGGVVMANGNAIQATWPARACNASPIKTLIRKSGVNLFDSSGIAQK